MANLYEKYKDDPEMLVAIAERGKYRNAGGYFLYK